MYMMAREHGARQSTSLKNDTWPLLLRTSGQCGEYATFTWLRFGGQDNFIASQINGFLVVCSKNLKEARSKRCQLRSSGLALSICRRLKHGESRPVGSRNLTRITWENQIECGRR